MPSNISYCLNFWSEHRQLVVAGQFVQTCKMMKKLCFNFCAESCFVRGLPFTSKVISPKGLSILAWITMLLTEIQAKTEGSRNFARRMMLFTCMTMMHSHMLRLATTVVLCSTTHRYNLCTKLYILLRITYSPIQIFVIDFQMRMDTVNRISAQFPRV